MFFKKSKNYNISKTIRKNFTETLSLSKPLKIFKAKVHTNFSVVPDKISKTMQNLIN